MESMPPKSWGKCTFTKITKPFQSKHHRQSQEHSIAGQPQDTLGVDQPDCGMSVPPDILQESTEQVHRSVLTSSVLAPTAQPLILGISVIDPLPDVPPTSKQTVLTAQIANQSAVSVTPAPISSVGITEVWMLSSSKPSPAMQTPKIVGKGILGLLSSAAEGIPVPGLKGIFDTIIKVINVIEVGCPNGCWRHGLITLLQTTQANQAAFKDLEICLNDLIETVIVPLKHKELSDIPQTLHISLAKLEQYFYITL
jgi:hypothetical protein